MSVRRRTVCGAVGWEKQLGTEADAGRRPRRQRPHQLTHASVWLVHGPTAAGAVTTEHTQTPLDAIQRQATRQVK